ncbi:hypothetical protein Mpsy_2752 [Methanolobus psychrophilus R15]|nr:hypothetical protein Mpsy_2752 [Methanolobus psychrophilus R15]
MFVYIPKRVEVKRIETTFKKSSKKSQLPIRLIKNAEESFQRTSL